MKYLDVAGVPESSEAPEFLLRTGNGTIGIEVTGLHADAQDGTNPRQAVTLMMRLVETVRDDVLRLPVSPVHATVQFRRGIKFSQREIPAIAQELATEIAVRVDEAELSGRLSIRPRDYHLAHRVAAGITMWKVKPGEPPRWTPRIAGMVRQATSEDLLATLRSKESKLRAYRRHSSAVWVVITCDVMADHNFVDPPSEHCPAITTGFDRVFCVSWNGDQVVEVPIARAG